MPKKLNWCVGLKSLLHPFVGQRRNSEVEVVLRLPQNMKPIETDPHKLKQILMNLVENALKFTQRGSVTVQVAVNPVGGRPVRIDVIDTGSGMPADRLKDIFEPFFQLNRSRQDVTGAAGGTGLGLSICRSLCDLLGYELKVSSEPGRGSTFSIILGEANRLPLTA